MNTVRRVSYVFLCIVPFLSFAVVGVRAFRVPGVFSRRTQCSLSIDLICCLSRVDSFTTVW